MSDAATGEIRIFAGNYAPQDWTICNGAMLKITDYQALYSLIGTAYGGDGVNTFGIPDLRGRLPVGMGINPTTNTNFALGAHDGTEQVTLTQANTPAHTHVFSATTAAATTLNATNTMLGTVTPSGTTTGLYCPPNGTGAKEVALNSNFLEPSYGTSGGTYPHENVMPFLAINYIMCLNGIYPDHQ